MEERDEQKEFETGPMSVLMQSVKNNTQVCLVSISHICCCLSYFVLFNLKNDVGANKLPQ